MRSRRGSSRNRRWKSVTSNKVKEVRAGARSRAGEGTSDGGQHSVSLSDGQVKHNGKKHNKRFSGLKVLSKDLVSQVKRTKRRSESNKTVEGGGKSSIVSNGEGVVGSDEAINKTLYFVEESNKLTGTVTILEEQVLRTRTVVLNTLKKSTTWSAS